MLLNKIIADIDMEQIALYKAIVHDDFRSMLALNEDDIFYLENHRKVFQILKMCIKDEIKTDLRVVHHNLVKYDLMEKNKAEELLAGIYSGHSMQDDDYILSVLKKLHLERRVFNIFSMYEEQRAGNATDVHIEDYIKKITLLYDEFQSGALKEGLNTLQACGKTYEELFESDDFKVYPTGFKSVDRVIFGFMGGQLIILGARQKKGKSTLALNIADNMGDVLFFGLEMKEKHNLSRIYSRYSKIHALRIFSGRVSRDERERLTEIIKGYKKNIEIIDHIKDIHEIIAYCRKKLKSGKFNKVFIDYIQLVRGGIGDSRNEKIAYISKALKDLSIEFNIPVVAVSQLSRECEKQNRRPISSDLRDSGALEQDADLILMLHEKDDRTILFIADSRNTPTGDIADLKADLQYSRFIDPESDEDLNGIDGYKTEEWENCTPVKPTNPDYFNN